MAHWFPLKKKRNDMAQEQTETIIGLIEHFQESTDDEQFRFFNYGQSRSEVQENRELVELMIADQMRDLQERKERGEPLYTPDMPSDARVFRYTTSKGAPYPPGSTQEYYDWQKNQGPKGDQPDPYHSFPAVSVVTPR